MKTRPSADQSSPDPGVRQAHEFYGSEYLTAPSPKGEIPGEADVVVVPEMFGAVPSPCGYIRLILPLDHLESGGELSVRIETSGSSSGPFGKVLILQRLAFKNESTLIDVVTAARQQSAWVIYDLDDDLLDLPTSHPERGHYRQYRPLIKRALSMADEVWASTPEIQAVVTPHCRTARVVKNSLDERLWAPIQRGEARPPGMRILYFGTNGHGPDIEILREPLERLRAKWGESVSLDVAGVGDIRGRGWYHPLPVPANAGCSYPAFVSWLRSISTSYDLGVVPLVDHPFNRGKSELKALDFGALGLPCVASNLPAVRRVITNGHDGLLVGNTAQAWHGALEEMAADETRRLRMGLAAREMVERGWTLSVTNGTRREALRDAIEGRSSLAGRSSPSVLVPETISVVPAETPTQSEGLPPDNSVALGRASLLNMLSGTGIEIGALHRPCDVPHLNVKYVDRMTKEEVHNSYPELQLASLVDVDIIDDGEALTTIADSSQDFVIANHVIEHMVNPLKALLNWARVLKPGGQLFLAVPDKTASFDHARPITALEHVIEDFEQPDERRDFEHFREFALMVSCRTFGVRPESESELLAKELWDKQYSIHYHVWDKPSFEQLLDYLTTARPGQWNVDVVETSPTSGGEFIFLLQRQQAGSLQNVS